jgi:hypothetical protein
MSSIRSQIMAALKAVLNADGAPCQFYRCRMNPFSPQQLPAGNFFPHQEMNHIDAGDDAAVLTIMVAAHVAATDDPVDEVADELLVWAEKQIMADDTLGGLCVWIEKKSTAWELAQKGVEQCVAGITFDVNYRTALTDTTANQS